MTAEVLLQAARDAVTDHERLRDKLATAYATFAPEHRANLLGPDPAWARYVLAIPVVELDALGVTPAAVMSALGTSERVRAYALAMLKLADAVQR